MTAPIDWQAALDGTRPVTTRDGRKVTLYCVDAPGNWPVHGRLEGDMFPVAWGLEGQNRATSNSQTDLIQAPKRIQQEYWLNVYKDYTSRPYASQSDANSGAFGERLACIRITIDCEEGEGL